jgi:hypothetical protein
VGVEAVEEFLNQSCLEAPRFFGVDQVTNDGFEPGVFADAEQDHRALVYLELIDRRLREYFAKHFHLLHHLSPNSCSATSFIIAATNARSELYAT